MPVNELYGYGLFKRTGEQLDNEILYSANDLIEKGGFLRHGEGVLVAGTVISHDPASGKWLKYDDTAAVNEVQTIDFGGTVSGGTYTLTYTHPVTGATGSSGPLAWNVANAVLLANLEAFYGAGTVAVTNGPSPTDTTITFQAGWGSKDIPPITVVSALTGSAPTVAIVETTKGVAGGATAHGILAGGADSTLGDVAINVYFTGWFKTAMLVGLDAAAITDLGAVQDTVYGWTHIR